MKSKLHTKPNSEKSFAILMQVFNKRLMHGKALIIGYMYKLSDSDTLIPVIYEDKRKETLWLALWIPIPDVT